MAIRKYAKMEEFMKFLNRYNGQDRYELILEGEPTTRVLLVPIVTTGTLDIATYVPKYGTDELETITAKWKNEVSYVAEYDMRERK